VRVILVIGAGASVAEALARHTKWGKDRPPLDMDFFARAKEAAREPSLVRRVAEHAARVGHVNPFESLSPTSLEHYLGLLYFSLLHQPSAEDKAAYFDLLRLYNRELLSTTNWLIGRKRGPLEMLIRRELSQGADDLAIVTFNHDLLIENALASLPPRDYGTRFCIHHSYSLPDDVSGLFVKGSELWDRCSGEHNEVVRIFKLHGSLNWVFTTRDLNPSLNLAQTKKKIEVLWLKRPRADLRVRRGQRRFYLWPVVVPPIYEKQGFIRNHLQNAWDGATKALSRADRVLFFGYSFPPADHHARFFFEGLASTNEKLRHPIIINPDFHVAQTAREVLRAESVRSYGSLDAYLDD
jgi:hypothetical protein